MSSKQERYLRRDERATYQILIQGILDSRWKDAVCGMNIIDNIPGDKQPVTTLRGELSDQSALAGVLNLIFLLGLPLLSVEYLDQESAVSSKV